MAARRDEKVTGRAVVTGANGTVGRRLTRLLIDHGWDVTAFSRSPISGQHTVIADLLDPASLDIGRAGAPVDVVFHLAAMMPDAKPDSPARFMDANATATLRLIESAAKNGVTRFVYASSVSVIGTPLRTPQDETHPLNPKFDYSVGKLGGELACAISRSLGMKAAALRLASIYGPGMARNTVLPLFVDRALAGEPIRWHGAGTRAQDFVHVDDAAAAMLQAAEANADGIYCIGSGQATTMRALAETIASLIPGARAEPSGQVDPQEGVVWLAGIGAAERDFGYAPQVLLSNGLARCLQ